MLTGERRRCRELLCGLVAGLTLSAARPGNEWFEVAPLPVPRAMHMTTFAATGSGPRVYAIGGQRSPTDTMERLCTEYSPQSNSWGMRSPMTQRRGLGQSCSVLGKVWVFGGCRTFGTALPYVEAYDPARDTWSSGPGMPTGQYDFGAAVWRDSLVFIVGGGSWHPSVPPTATVRLFDPNIETWYVATSLPVPLGAVACGIVGDTLLVATGWTSSGPTNRAWRGVLDPSNPRVISWQELDTLPGPRRCRTACGVADNHLFVIGGLSLQAGSSLGLHPSSFSLQPSGFSGLNDVWSIASDGQWVRCADKREAVSCVSGSASDASGHVYVAGGYSGAAPYLKTTEFLDVSSYDHDVGVTGIISPAGRLSPAVACPVSVMFHNFGAAAESLSAHVAVVDSPTQSPVFTGDSTFSLLPDSSRLVEFGTFLPPVYTVFHTTAFVTLAGDQNPTNDTVRARSRTTTGSDRDGYGYVYKTTQEPDNMTFSWFDTSGGSVIDDWTPNGDEGLSRRELPFYFNFYGNAFNRIYVCTNGYIQTSNTIASLNLALPYEGISNIIAPFWDDLTVRDSGQVIENFTSDKMVYTWVGARRQPPDTGRLTFQAILQLNGDIRINYLNITADSASSTIGIQGIDGGWNWYQEYVYSGDPPRHVPTSQTSILFDAPPLGVSEQQKSALKPIGLQLPTVCRGPVPITAGPGVLSIQVFNVSGSLVRSFTAAGRKLSAVGGFTWDRRDQHGRPLPAGAYLVRAVSRQTSLTRKLVLLD